MTINTIDEGKAILKKHYNKQKEIAIKSGIKEDILWIEQKYIHSLEVFKMSEYLIENDEILKNLPLKIKLYGKLGALLHDIGRFYEIGKIERSSTQHGVIGANILEQEENENNIFLIYSFKYHDDFLSKEKTLQDLNKLNLNEKDKENIILLLNLIKDSDKLSNFELFKNIDKVYFLSKELLPFFTDSCLNNFKNRQLINNKEKQSIFDQMLGYIVWCYDLNFYTSKLFIKNNNYLFDFISMMKKIANDFNNKSDTEYLLNTISIIEKQLKQDNLLK